MQGNRPDTENLFINIEQLKRFYGVDSKTDLIKAQAVHIDKLQKALVASTDRFQWTYRTRSG